MRSSGPGSSIRARIQVWSHATPRTASVPEGGMQFTIDRMSEDDAREIAGWSYEKPYDVYNIRPDELGVILQSFLEPSNAYHAFRVVGELVGFCCFGPDARVAGGEYIEDGVLDV